MTQNIRSWTNGLVGNFLNLFSSTLGIVLNSLLVIVVTIMLLANPTPYKQIFLLMFPAFYRQRVQTILKKIESNVLTPIVMKRQVSLLPAVTLLSQVAFAVFFGILGLFLALPITVVARVWLKEIIVKDILERWQLNKEHNHFNNRKSKAKKILFDRKMLHDLSYI